MFTITVDLDKCDGCGECVDSCPAECLSVEDGKCVYDEEVGCMGCETCMTVCPNQAITMTEL